MLCLLIKCDLFKYLKFTFILKNFEEMNTKDHIHMLQIPVVCIDLLESVFLINTLGFWYIITVICNMIDQSFGKILTFKELSHII